MNETVLDEVNETRTLTNAIVKKPNWTPAKTQSVHRQRYEKKNKR